MKTLKEQYDLVNKWKKEHVVRKTAEIPKKDYEWFNAELQRMGISYNKWVRQKIKELKELGGEK